MDAQAFKADVAQALGVPDTGTDASKIVVVFDPISIAVALGLLNPINLEPEDV